MGLDKGLVDRFGYFANRWFYAKGLFNQSQQLFKHAQVVINIEYATLFGNDGVQAGFIL